MRKIIAAWLLMSGFAAAQPAPAPYALPFGYGVRTAWTPTIIVAGSGADWSVTCATATGYSTRVGSLAYLEISMTCTQTYTSTAGNLQISNLPFLAASNATSYPMNIGTPTTTFTWSSGAATMLIPQVSSNTRIIQLMTMKSGVVYNAVQNTVFATGTAFTLNITGWYTTTSS